MATVAWSTPSHFSATMTLDQYAIVAKELHEKLVEAGLLVADDTGQLDFDSLTGAFPATFKELGYRIYQLNDGVSLPLFIKIVFAVAHQANGSDRGAYALRVYIGFETDGAGTILSGAGGDLIGGTQSTYFPRNPANGVNQASCICVAEGFVGVVWKEKYLNVSANYVPDGNASNQPPLAAFFVCRDTDSSGEPVPTGASLVQIGMSRNTTSYGAAPKVTRLSVEGFEYSTSRTALLLGSDVITSVGGSVPVNNIFTLTPTPERLAQIGIAPRLSMGDKDVMQLALKGLEKRTFIALPNVFPADTFTGTGSRASFVMLWE